MVDNLALQITAAVGVAAGIILGRSSKGPHLNKITNGNCKWMTKEEKSVAAALYSEDQGYFFKSWPPPGIKDAEKRRMLLAAAEGMREITAALEPQRLALLEAPLCRKATKLIEAHGDTREDLYYWLRDDTRTSDAVLQHLEAENRYTSAVMADTEEIQKQLYKEMRSRIKEEDTGVPERRGGFFYYHRTQEGQQYRIRCRRRVPERLGPLASEDDTVDESEPEEILLDENERRAAGGHEFYSVAEAEPSPDHRLLAWAEDSVGGEKYEIRIRDLETKQDLPDRIPETAGELAWANECRTLFYSVKDALDRPYRVLRHVVGTPVSEDVVVFDELDPQFYVGLSKSRSEQFILISSSSAVTSETHLIWAREPEAPPRLLVPRQHDVEYSVYPWGRWILLLWRDAERPNLELRVIPLDEPNKMTVLLPHRADVKLSGLSVSARHLAVFQRSGGLPRVVVYDLHDKLSAASPTNPPSPLLEGEAREVAFEAPAYSLEGGGSGDFDSHLLRLEFTSLTTPSSIIDVNMETGRRVVKRVQPVLGGYLPEDYVTKRVWAQAPDGARVPISLVHRKGVTRMDGSDPLLLNGYGSYEISNDPYFSSNRLSLLDRGFIFAIAHVRGGGEMGRFWYEDGKFLKKTNTFTDFVACAEHLVQLGYTSPARLCIEGRSAGGMLIGWAVNTRPDLFRAAILGVGFVDVLTTMLDDTIPLTSIERDEWGDPAADSEVYRCLKGYSPVDNVRRQPYPWILATMGLHDPRVGYWEPAKFIAKVRELKTDDNVQIQKCEMGAGHFSVTGRFERLKEIAFEYAFLLKSLGM